MIVDPPSSTESLLPWLLKNRDALVQLIQRVNALDDLKVVVVKNGVRTTYAAQWSDKNGVVEIQV